MFVACRILLAKPVGVQSAETLKHRNQRLKIISCFDLFDRDLKGNRIGLAQV